MVVQKPRHYDMRARATMLEVALLGLFFSFSLTDSPTEQATQYFWKPEFVPYHFVRRTIYHRSQNPRYIVVAVLTLTRIIIKSVVTGQAPVTLELRNTPGKKHKQTKGGTRIYHSWRNSYLHQNHIKSEIGSQPTMCQVYTGAYVSPLAPGKN